MEFQRLVNSAYIAEQVDPHLNSTRCGQFPGDCPVEDASRSKEMLSRAFEMKSRRSQVIPWFHIEVEYGHTKFRLNGDTEQVLLDYDLIGTRNTGPADPTGFDKMQLRNMKNFATKQSTHPLLGNYSLTQVASTQLHCSHGTYPNLNRARRKRFFFSPSQSYSWAAVRALIAEGDHGLHFGLPQ